MPGRTGRHRRLLAAALPLAIALAAGGCGGGEAQDANEEEGTWKVDVLSASFPGKQTLAETSELRIKVKNLENSELPNLAVTVDGFDQRSENPDRSPIRAARAGWSRSHPRTRRRRSPTPGRSARCPAGETRTLIWKVTAVRAGTYTLRYRVAAGLDGKARRPCRTASRQAAASSRA